MCFSLNIEELQIGRRFTNKESDETWSKPVAITCPIGIIQKSSGWNKKYAR